MAIEIQTEPTEILEDPRKYVMMIYGCPGVGKTTWASQIPGHYFAKTEEGTKGLRVWGSPIQKWDDFLELCVALGKYEGERKIHTLVVDTLERLYWFCGDWLCKHKRFMVRGTPQSFEDIRHVPYGLGYAETAKEILRVFNKINLDLGLGLVLIAHERERTIIWRGEELPKYEPDLPPSAVTALTAFCDAVGRFEIKQKITKDKGDVVQVEEGRYQQWQPEFGTIAKHRLTGFPAILELPRDRGYQVYEQAFRDCVSNNMKGGETE